MVCFFETEVVFLHFIWQNENWNLATCTRKFELPVKVASCLDQTVSRNWNFVPDYRVHIKRTSDLTVIPYMYHCMTLLYGHVSQGLGTTKFAITTV